MSSVTVRDLRNRSADLLARVTQGERVIVTKDGTPVAEVVPLPRAPFNAEQLVDQFARLPRIDAERFRRDLDEIVDPAL